MAGKVSLKDGRATEPSSAPYADVVNWYEPMLRIALRSRQGYWVDAGCQHGYVTEFLRRNGVLAIGVDVDRGQLKSTLVKDLYVVADIESLPFKDDSINGILALEVLEHLPNPLKAIREFHRVLKRGGSFMITTPTPTSPNAGNRGHVCVKSRKAWISVVRRSGFKVRVVRYRYRFSPKFPLPGLATRLVEFLLMSYKRYIGVSSTKLRCIKK